jgi:hypothetical protein
MARGDERPVGAAITHRADSRSQWKVLAQGIDGGPVRRWIAPEGAPAHCVIPIIAPGNYSVASRMDGQVVDCKSLVEVTEYIHWRVLDP